MRPNQLNMFSKGSNGAIFSDCRNHRFVLWRIWDESLPKAMFIGLNPSTANEDKDDATIRRVIKFAKSWGYGGVYMLNLFTYVTAYPEELKTCQNPLLMADEFLKMYAKDSEKIIFAWGSFYEAKERAIYVIKMFPSAYTLVRNKDGSPRHPLYVPGKTKLSLFINENKENAK